MKGLIFWAHSYCRSVLAFYKGIADEYDVPFKIYIWKGDSTLRTKVGFKEDEFKDLDITILGNNYPEGLRLLNEYKHYHHIFCAYQNVKIYQKLIIEGKKIGCKIAIASESPCNMYFGLKRIIKNIYTNYILPIHLKKVISCADYIINFSGDDKLPLEKIGWKKNKIIPCGYYSPAIIGSKCIQRTEEHWEKFRILLTGIHQKHRSPMLLLKALNILNKRGVKFECDITQNGPLYKKMKKFVIKHKMKNVHLLGFVTIDKLIQKYETCSVYVGTGNYEPWGIRLNDALLCGAPLIINKGMGGHKLVKDYECGLLFDRNDYIQLANVLERVIKEKDTYLRLSNAAYTAAKKISPSVKAKEIVDNIKSQNPDWI